MFHGLKYTVSEIMNFECMRKSKVLGGHSGLNRSVKNVTVMDVPDIINWVFPGDLLLTTAYAVYQDESALVRLVSQLADKGIAGLAIKPKRFLQNIPPQMIVEADRYSLPLIELSEDTSFSRSINLILGEVLNTQAIYLAQSERSHQLFMDVILNGGGLKAITSALSQLIKNSVIIVNGSEKILAQSLVNWTQESLESALSMRTGLPKTTIDPLNTGVKFVKTCIAEEPLLHEFRINISARNHRFGCLVFWDNNNTLNNKDFISIEKAMPVAALELLNEKSLLEVERRYQNEFIDDLIHNSYDDEKSLIERARHLGWNLDNDHVAFVVDIDNFRSYTDKVLQDEEKILKSKDKLYKRIHDTLIDDNTILGTKSDSIIILIPQPQSLSPDQIKSRCFCRGEKILSETNGHIHDFTVSIGVGCFHPGVNGLRQSYFEAIEALRIGKLLNKSNSLIFFDDLGVYRLLADVINKNALEQFYGETVKALDMFDKHNNAELMKTLKVFFLCDCNVSEVSKKLFIHYNTAVQRLQRIESITKFCLKSSEDKLNLQIGLKFFDLLS